LSELKEVRGAVEVSPHHFSVIGVVAASETLLASIIEEGDASSCQCKGKSTLKESLIRVGMKEARIVMVINKDTECIDIMEVLVVSCPPIRNISHAFSVHPHISDGVVHGVVEECGKVVLVGADVCVIAVEALTHLEDTSGCTELLPEVLGNLRNCVDTDAVEVVSRDKVLDPVLELLANPSVALVEIW